MSKVIDFISSAEFLGLLGLAAIGVVLIAAIADVIKGIVRWVRRRQG